MLNQQKRFEILECTAVNNHDTWVVEQFNFVPLPEGECMPAISQLGGYAHLIPSRFQF
jgi:hypothetical protein